MRRVFSLLSILLLTLSLTGCFNKKTGDNAYGCSVLNVYNWGEYIDENVLYEFEDQFNCRVNYSLFASNEELYTKLLSGSHYDVLVPSDYMIQKLMAEELIQPLDKSIITALPIYQ